MAKTASRGDLKQLAIRVPTETYKRFEAMRTALQLTQADAIAAGTDALEAQLTSEQRRTFQFFLKQPER